MKTHVFNDAKIQHSEKNPLPENTRKYPEIRGFRTFYVTESSGMISIVAHLSILL